MLIKDLKKLNNFFPTVFPKYLEIKSDYYKIYADFDFSFNFDLCSFYTLKYMKKTWYLESNGFIFITNKLLRKVSIEEIIDYITTRTLQLDVKHTAWVRGGRQGPEA